MAKIYWPEESRASEVEILKKAKKYGEKIALIGKHIPDVVCHKDPVFAGCSTSTIRKFLGLSTKGAHRLRVIVSRRLIPIGELEEEEMLLAFLRCVRLLRFSGFGFDRFALQPTSVYGRKGSNITTSALRT